jgi:putative SOS response-associated peptidase YedK
MCYNLNAKAKIKELKERYDATFENEEEHQEYYSVSGFAHPNLPVLTSEESKIFSYKSWGLIPFWTQDIEKSKIFSNNNLNAKSETIFEKPSFNTVIRKKRCIIPVNGFFEWRDINKVKYPHYITLKDDSIFSLAGIYDNWTDKVTGIKTSTFSILTTEANPLMAKIHNLKLRMPLILPKEKEMDWIKQEVSDEELNNLMLPFDESLMKAHTISRRIYKQNRKP